MSPAPMPLGPLFPFNEIYPVCGADVFIAPTAAVIGDVHLDDGCSVWFSVVIRGDDMPIRIGRGTNIQDGVVIHGTENVAGTTIGSGVVIGHGAMIHGATIADGAMVGIGAVLLDGAVVEAGAVVAAGALVPPRKTVPANMLWIGNPGTVRRPVNDAEKTFIGYAADHYSHRSKLYIDALRKQQYAREP